VVGVLATAGAMVDEQNDALVGDVDQPTDHHHSVNVIVGDVVHEVHEGFVVHLYG